MLEAALALADAGGFHSLSMRRVAAKLGVEAMSLYGHVAGKEDIVDGLVDMVVDEIVVPVPGSVDWRTAMRARAISARDALNRHRWAVGLVGGRMRAGLMDAYVHGFALLEQPGHDHEAEFRFGLELILDGIERAGTQTNPGCLIADCGEIRCVLLTRGRARSGLAGRGRAG